MTENELKKEIEKILHDFCHLDRYHFVDAAKALLSLAKAYKKAKKK